MAIQFPFSFNRLNRIPLDSSSVFANIEDFETYLSTGAGYAGQIVAIRNETNRPSLYIVNEDFSASRVGVDVDEDTLRAIVGEMDIDGLTTQQLALLESVGGIITPDTDLTPIMARLDEKGW